MRLSVALALAVTLPAHACWEDAASRYQVSSALLYAIARTESGLNPQALGRVVEGKVFLQTPDGWMERGYAGEKVTELTRGGDAFNKLAAEHPAVEKISALGGVVLFRFDTTWYHLTGGEAAPTS